MAKKSCKESILEAFKDSLTDAEAKRIVEHFKETRKRLPKELREGYTIDAARLELQDFLNNYREAKKIQIYNHEKMLNQLMDDHIAIKSNPKYYNNPDQYIQSKLEPIAGLASGGSVSRSLYQKSMEARLINKFLDELDNSNVSEIFMNDSIWKDIVRAHYAISGGKSAEDFGVAGRIASILQGSDKMGLAMKNNYGAFISELDTHLNKTIWSEKKVNELGFDEFRKHVEDSFDPSMYKGMTPEEIFADQQADFLKIANGTFHRELGSAEFEEFGKTKIFDSLGKRMAKRRKYHFKDADAYITHLEKYSDRGFAESILAKMRNTARDSSILATLGGSPATYYKRLISTAAEAVKDNPKALERLKSKKEYLTKIYEEDVRGASKKSGDGLAAKASTAIMTGNIMSKLGFAAVRAGFTDPINAMMYMKTQQGKNLFDSIGGTLSSFQKVLGAENTRKYAKMLDVSLVDEMSIIHEASGVEKVGLSSKLLKLYNRLSMMKWQTQKGSVAGARIASIGFADSVGKGIDELDIRLKGLMDRFGFDDEQWKILQKGGEDINGVSYITPEKLGELDDKVFEASFKKDSRGFDNLQAYKMDLTLRYSNALNDAGDSFVVKPNSEDRTHLYGNLNRDSVIGATLHTLVQFKSYSLAQARYFRRLAFSDPTKAGFVFTDFKDIKNLSTNVDVKNLGMAIAGLMFATYFHDRVREVLQNKVPTINPFSEDVTEDKRREMLTNMFVGGGAAGYYTDFLASLLHKQYGSTPLESLVGPIAGNFKDIQGVFSGLLDEDKDVSERASVVLRALYKNAPGNNLWYAKSFLDMAILDGLMEFTDPEYVGKREAAFKEKGETHIFDI